MRWLLSCVVLILMSSFAAAQDMPLTQILAPGEGWKPVKAEFKSIGGLTADARGNVYVADPENEQILRLNAEGKAEVFARTKGEVRKLRAGPDGKLYGFSDQDEGAIVVIDAEGERTLVKSFAGIDMVIARGGDLY